MESHGYSLRYADGTPHYSSGTTCYQWASKGAAMQNQTLATLNRTGVKFRRCLVMSASTGTFGGRLHASGAA